MGAPRCCGRDLLYALILSLGSLTFGYIVAFPSPAESIIFKKDDAPDPLGRLFFKSISSLTAILGPFVVNFLLSPRLQLGRRITCFILSVTGCLFWSLLLIVFVVGKQDNPENHHFVAIVGRALLGLTMGSFSALTPMYVVEIAPPALTGIFGTFPQVFIASGVSLCYLVGILANQDGLGAWYVLVGFGAGIDALLSFLIWLVPESPAIIQEQNRTANESGETVCSAKWLPFMIQAALFGFFQQFTGINAIVTDVHTLFGMAGVRIDGFQDLPAFLASTTQIIACIASGPLINALGRARVWMLSFAICAVADMGYAVCHSKPKGLGPWWLQLAIVGLHLLGFGLGAGPIAWFIVPEMFPAIVRPQAVVVAAVSNWVCSFVVIALFAGLRENWRMIEWSFVAFAIISLGGVEFGHLYVRNPELEDDMRNREIYDDLVSSV
jgi:MFS family permease